MGDCKVFWIEDNYEREYSVSFRLDNDGNVWLFDFEEYQKEYSVDWGMDSTLLAGILAKLNELNGVK